MGVQTNEDSVYLGPVPFGLINVLDAGDRSSQTGQDSHGSLRAQFPIIDA